MKKIKILLSIAVMILCLSTVKATSVESQAKPAADTTVYVCPMKCEGNKTYEKAGSCPVCRMALKAQAKSVASIYQCPMKCEGEKTYDKAGKCPKCNMNLKKVEPKKATNAHEGHNHK